MTVRINTPQEQKIVQSTVNYFRRYPQKRGLAEVGGCVYVAKNGCRCAVGKWMTDKVVTNKDFIEDLNTAGDLEYLRNDLDRGNDIENLNEEYIPDYINSFDDLMVKDAKGLSPQFWLNLQTWHDSKDHWNSGGLTDRGYDQALSLGWIDPRRNGKGEA